MGKKSAVNSQIVTPTPFSTYWPTTVSICTGLRDSVDTAEALTAHPPLWACFSSWQQRNLSGRKRLLENQGTATVTNRHQRPGMVTHTFSHST